MKENRQRRKTLDRIRSGHGIDAAWERRRQRISAAQLPDIVGSPAEHLTKLTRGHDTGMSRARAQLRDRRELPGDAGLNLGTVARDARLVLIVGAPAEHTLCGGRAAVIGSRRDPVDARAGYAWSLRHASLCLAFSSLHLPRRHAYAARSVTPVLIPSLDRKASMFLDA